MIVLIGFMGAGKTTVGRLLADRLGVAFLDSDVMVEGRTGRRVTDIFALEGEERFRELERAVIAELVDAGDGVLSVGGGAVNDERTRAALRRAEVVHLEVSYGEARHRLPGDDTRPVLRRADLEDVYWSRVPAYASAANIAVATDGRSPEQVVQAIVEQLARTH